MRITNFTDLGLTDLHSGCACGTKAGCACGAGADQGCACGSTAHGHAPHQARGHAHKQAHGHGQESASTAGMSGRDVVRAHYLVEGMTCSHCVSSVTEELTTIDGVDSVSVDLNVGGASRVMVVSANPVPVEGIRAAIDEAGYTLVDSR